MNAEGMKPGSGNEVDDAQREVARAERALSRSLHDASTAGRETVARALHVAKPVLIGVAAVAGVIWLIRRLRRPKGPAWLTPASERSVLGEAARAATLSIASRAARKLADHWLEGPGPGAAASTAQNDRPSSRRHFD